MKPLRGIVTIVWVVASFIANAGDPLADKAECAANQPADVDLQRLQGAWEGVDVHDPLHQKITITVTGHSLHFYRDTNFWFETTIVLPAGTDPKQLHATIKGNAQGQKTGIGEVVMAIFKIEDEKLTIVTISDDAEQTPNSFEGPGPRYELRIIQSEKKNTQPTRTK